MSNELSIEEWNSFMERLPEVSPIVDISCVLSTDHKFLCIDDETAEMHGVDPDDFVGKPCYELVHGTDEPIDGCPCQEVLETGEPAESDLFKEDDRYYVAAAAPIEDDTGDIVALAHTVRDITEQKRREQQLQRERDHLDDFAGVISHDLRNPLNVAQARLELAMDETDSEHHDPIADALHRMERIIEDVLWLAREGRDIGETEPIKLRDAAENAWQLINDREEYELIYVPATPESQTIIVADHDRLCQLFENLFNNAIEHAGPDVTIRFEELGDGIAIEDDGPGIDPEQRGDVFDAGYSTAKEGTGFGLNIVKQIVAAHEWDICITEGAEGGARFEITSVEFQNDGRVLP